MGENKPTIVKFVKEKETKNTIRFSEVAEAGKPFIIGSLYLQKWFVGDASRITLTVEKA